MNEEYRGHIFPSVTFSYNNRYVLQVVVSLVSFGSDVIRILS